MQFQDDLAAGVVLVRPALQSPDYLTGVSGWAVKIDGSAEFNNVTIRGATSVGGIALYYDGTPAAGNLLMSFAPAAGTDAYGNAYQAGMTLYSVDGYINTSNAANTGTTWHSNSGAEVIVGAGPGAVDMSLMPPSVTGVTWQGADVSAGVGSRLGTSTPLLNLSSPYNTGLAGQSNIQLFGSPKTSNGDVTNEIFLTAARTTVGNDLWVLGAVTSYSSWSTFTPVWNNVGTATFGTNIGWWKRVGDIYLFEIYTVASAAGSGTTNITISGLPFNPFRAGTGANTTRQSARGHFSAVAAGTNSSVSGVGTALVTAGGAASTIDNLSGPTAISLRGENISSTFIATIQGWMRAV